MFADPGALRAVGALYLRRHPEEAVPVRLLMHQSAMGRIGAQDALARMIAERRRVDLEREDVVVVAGWVLARSEARLCATASLDAAT